MDGWCLNWGTLKNSQDESCQLQALKKLLSKALAAMEAMRQKQASSLKIFERCSQVQHGPSRVPESSAVWWLTSRTSGIRACANKMEAVLTQSRMQQSHQTLGKSWCHRVGIGWVASSPSLDMLSNTAFCVWYSFMYGRELIEKGTECFSSKSMLQILNQCKSTFFEAQFHKTILYKTSHKMQATLLSVFWFARHGHARLTVAPPRSSPEATIPVSPLLSIAGYCWVLSNNFVYMRPWCARWVWMNYSRGHQKHLPTEPNPVTLEIWWRAFGFCGFFWHFPGTPFWPP